MKRAVLAIYVVLATASAKGAPANSDWNCENGLTGMFKVLGEERGKIGGTDVCVLDALCLKRGFANFFFSNEVFRIKAYCLPNRSGRCPSKMQDCVNSKEIAQTDISKIKFYNTSKCENETAERSQNATTLKQGEVTQ